MFIACMDLKMKPWFPKICMWSLALNGHETLTIGTIQRKGSRSFWNVVLQKNVENWINKKYRDVSTNDTWNDWKKKKTV